MIASARPFPRRGQVQGVQGGRRPPAHRRAGPQAGVTEGLSFL